MMKGTQRAQRQRATVRLLLERHGTTFAGELGIDLARNTPSMLFRWLCASLLLSAPVSSALGMRGARALAEAGWRTAAAMSRSRWADRARALNEAGYARVDERTATMLGDVVDVLLRDYGGDLRRLRREADGDPRTVLRLLKRFKGIGDVGASIFCREAQIAWDELYPFADGKALAAARRLGLPGTAEGLAELVDRDAFPRLVAALVSADLAHDLDALKQAAAAG
jgi:hypothetical protein